MNTRLLVQFMAVANAGTITAASRQLNIAQPALSHAIATLENELGVRLFERHRRGVELTEAGSILYERTRPILDSLEGARLAVQEVDPAPSGRVNIAVPASVAHAITEPLFRRVQGRFKRIHLVIDEALTGHLPRWLRSGQADLIVRFDAADDDEFHSTPLVRETLYLVGKGLGPEPAISFRSLKDYSLFLPDSQHGMGRAIAHYEDELGIRLQRIPISASIHSVLRLVDAGLGHAIVPWSIIYDRVGIDGLAAQQIVEPEITRSAFLCRRRSGPQSSAVTAVGDAILWAVSHANANGNWHGALLFDDSAT